MEDSRKYLDPKILGKLSRLDIKARLIVEGFISGLHESPYHGFSVEFAQHREYVPGDDIRHVDWKVWAKSDRFYIKEYEEETNLKAHILLDVSESMAYQSQFISKFDYACYIAASLAYLMLQQQDSVGLVMFDDKIRKMIGDSSHSSHLKLILNELETAQTSGNSKMDTVFHDLAERIKRKGLLILISDLLADPEALLSGLQHARHKRHEVIVFHVLDEAERTFPFESMTLFQGMEDFPDLFVEPLSLRDSYLQKLHDFCLRVQRGCRERRIDYVPLSTSDPLDVALTRYFANRLRRG